MGDTMTGATTKRPSESTHRSTASLLAEVTKRSKSNVLLMGIVAAVVLGIVIGMALTYFGTRGKGAGGRSRRSPAALIKDMVTLRFKVSPPEAKLLIDGRERAAPQGGGERVVRVPWQETPLLVKVTAVGYQPEQRPVMPDRDQTLEIQLKRQKTNISPLPPMDAKRPRRRRPRRKRSMGQARSP